MEQRVVYANELLHLTDVHLSARVASARLLLLTSSVLVLCAAPE
jgi:hypothetical protein